MIFLYFIVFTLFGFLGNTLAENNIMFSSVGFYKIIGIASVISIFSYCIGRISVDR